MDAFHHATPAQPLLLADPPPRLIVDLSNVCRERALGAGNRRAAWERFVRVMHAWERQLGGVPRGLALADENLRFLLCERDRVALEAAERDGIVRSVSGSADREILRLAERHGACVLSGDRFRGHRGRHPWIQGCVDRFFAWELGPDGELTIVACDMGHTSAPSLSRHAELDELRDRGLDARLAADRGLLGHGYRCTNEACLTARWHPDRLLVPPEQRDGQPRCPGCGCPLADLGPRPATVKVVIERRDGAKLLERTLEEGQELQLGRADLLDADDPQLPRVSRRHVQLSLRDGRLWARDLDSRNGTTLIRWDERHAAGAPAVALAGEPLALGPRDLLVLAGAVRLRRSGERFAIAAPAAEDPRRATGATTTDDDVREAR